MRIIAGQFRGTKLAALGKGDAGAHLRPTSDRVRESLFSMLTSGRYGAPVQDANVLDLFAGTGALGLEALSRGASHVTFVENGRKAQGLIRENVAKCRAEGQTNLITRDATRLGAGTPHDLIFLDPPYGKGLGERALKAAATGGWLSGDALVVWEESAVITPPGNMDLLDQRTYGGTIISLLRVRQV